MNKTVVTFLAGAIVISSISFALWWILFSQKPLPDGLIQVNGRIEGDHYTVSCKVPGRISKIFAREGDLVQEGQTIAKLDDAQATAKVDQAKQAVATIAAQLKAANTSLDILKKEVPLLVQTAEAALSSSKAQLTSAKATAAQSHKDLIRYAHLFSNGAVDRRKYEQIRLSKDLAESQLKSAQEAVRTCAKQLDQAKLGYEKIKVKQDEIEALEAQLIQAKAALREADSLLNDLTIRAPASGIIITRMVDAGEVVIAGTPLFDIVDMDRLYLQVYVPEHNIGKIRRGLPARVYVDAFPEEFFDATIRYIASRAQFTPKEVQTKDERVKLVYAVKLYINANTEHRLTPGIPADAIIRWKDSTPWVKPRRW